MPSPLDPAIEDFRWQCRIAAVVIVADPLHSPNLQQKTTPVASEVSTIAPALQSRRVWSRFVTVLLGVSLVLLSVIWFAGWYQHDRPLREIETALKKGQTSQSLKLVGGFLRDHPDDVRAQILRARILVEGGQLTEALRVFHTVGASDTVDLHAWAKAHLLRQEWSDALPVLERMLQISPKDPDALHEITACRAFLGNYPQAFDSARQLSAQPGHEARGWLQIGTLHENLGNDQSAIEAWQKVLLFDPNAERLQVAASEFFGEYGRVLLKDGQTDRAREELERSVQLRETPQIRAILGSAFQQLGDEPKAIENWKRAVAQGPALREPRESLALSAFRTGQFDDARVWLEPVLTSARPLSSSTYLMQRICVGLGQRDAARHWQERTDELHKREKLQSAINHTMIEAPDSFWARAIRAYQFAEAGNWHQAEVLTRGLLAEAAGEPFVRELAICIRNRGPLPSLELLPVHRF